MKKQSILIFLLSSVFIARSQSPWNTNGSNIYYNTGNVGIGASNPASKLHVEQSAAGFLELASFVNPSTTGKPFITVGRTSPLALSTGAAFGYDAFNNAAFIGIGGDDPSAGTGIVIKKLGNVGLGTNAPLFKLDMTTNGSNDGIRIVQSGGSSAALHLDNVGGGGGRHWALFSTGYGNNQGAGNFSIFQYTDVGYDRLFIKGEDGNVGIGTKFPNRRLTVAGNLLFGENYDANGIYWNNLEIMVDGTHPVSKGISVAPSGTNTGAFDFYVNTYQPNASFNFYSQSGPTAANTLMRILNSGQVQIGNPLANTSPHYNDSKLTVKGKAVFQEVVVTINNWADYVFQKDYHLLPLAEVESYIHKNHHLPNLPTAKEIENGGASLGEISKLQMEKIEELTLYVIELKKEIETLKKKVN